MPRTGVRCDFFQRPGAQACPDNRRAKLKCPDGCLTIEAASGLCSGNDNRTTAAGSGQAQIPVTPTIRYASCFGAFPMPRCDYFTGSGPHSYQAYFQNQAGIGPTWTHKDIRTLGRSYVADYAGNLAQVLNTRLPNLFGGRCNTAISSAPEMAYIPVTLLTGIAHLDRPLWQIARQFPDPPGSDQLGARVSACVSWRADPMNAMILGPRYPNGTVFSHPGNDWNRTDDTTPDKLFVPQFNALGRAFTAIEPIWPLQTGSSWHIGTFDLRGVRMAYNFSGTATRYVGRGVASGTQPVWKLVGFTADGNRIPVGTDLNEVSLFTSGPAANTAPAGDFWYWSEARIPFNVNAVTQIMPTATIYSRVAVYLMTNASLSCSATQLGLSLV